MYVTILSFNSGIVVQNYTCVRTNYVSLATNYVYIRRRFVICVPEIVVASSRLFLFFTKSSEFRLYPEICFINSSYHYYKQNPRR